MIFNSLTQLPRTRISENISTSNELEVSSIHIYITDQLCVCYVHIHITSILATTKPIYRLMWDEDRAASALMDPQIHYTLVLGQ
jgi:hypothetical protein